MFCSGAAVPPFTGRHGAVCGVSGGRTGQRGLWKRPAVCQQAAEGSAGPGGGGGRTQRKNPGTQGLLTVSLLLQLEGGHVRVIYSIFKSDDTVTYSISQYI